MKDRYSVRFKVGSHWNEVNRGFRQLGRALTTAEKLAGQWNVETVQITLNKIGDKRPVRRFN
jgi:hypothetical protein